MNLYVDRTLSTILSLNFFVIGLSNSSKFEFLFTISLQLFDSKKVEDHFPKKMGRSLQTRGLSKIFVK
jgi:hypothetical protein